MSKTTNQNDIETLGAMVEKLESLDIATRNRILATLCVYFSCEEEAECVKRAAKRFKFSEE